MNIILGPLLVFIRNKPAQLLHNQDIFFKKKNIFNTQPRPTFFKN